MYIELYILDRKVKVSGKRRKEKMDETLKDSKKLILQISEDTVY